MLLYKGGNIRPFFQPTLFELTYLINGNKVGLAFAFIKNFITDDPGFVSNDTGSIFHDDDVAGDVIF